ncbi:siphovirus Gp157 family protein [Eisenbergiella porci]|uniref:siphovirus Gp157 family protein n=1 Tax=Eisenbergiella porci TaxID=2652274 RepID=UPI002A7FE991|nr:siphovirus Gp157 family protein [Eisenbergiella porci]
MSTLYEITGQYLQLLEMLEEEDNLEEQVVKDTLEGIEGELEIKADGYARIIRELDTEAVKYEAEKKRLEERSNALRNRSRILKDHLYNSMKVTGKTKFKTDLFSFGIQKNGGLQPMEIVPDVEIPDEYLKKEPDNIKIREAIKEGKSLPFAVLKERGDHLVIR